MKKLKMFKKSEQYHFSLEILVLYILNVVDLVLTQVSLSTGKVYEANPLMVDLMNNLPMAILLKVVLLGLALFAIVYFAYRWEIKIVKFLHVLILSAVAIYSFVNINHIVNFILIFVVKV